MQALTCSLVPFAIACWGPHPHRRQNHRVARPLLLLFAGNRRTIAFAPRNHHDCARYQLESVPTSALTERAREKNQSTNNNHCKNKSPSHDTRSHPGAPAATTEAVDCFKCSSHNGSNPACEDPFHNLNTTRVNSPILPDPQPSVIYHTPCYSGKKGREGLFPASACIKLMGVFGEYCPQEPLRVLFPSRICSLDR